MEKPREKRSRSESRHEASSSTSSKIRKHNNTDEHHSPSSSERCNNEPQDSSERLAHEAGVYKKHHNHHTSRVESSSHRRKEKSRSSESRRHVTTSLDNEPPVTFKSPELPKSFTANLSQINRSLVGDLSEISNKREKFSVKLRQLFGPTQTESEEERERELINRKFKVTRRPRSESSDSGIQEDSGQQQQRRLSSEPPDVPPAIVEESVPTQSTTTTTTTMDEEDEDSYVSEDEDRLQIDEGKDKREESALQDFFLQFSVLEKIGKDDMPLLTKGYTELAVKYQTLTREIVDFEPVRELRRYYKMTLPMCQVNRRPLEPLPQVFFGHLRALMAYHSECQNFEVPDYNPTTDLQMFADYSSYFVVAAAKPAQKPAQKRPYQRKNQLATPLTSALEGLATAPSPAKKSRGRVPGSKNKPKLPEQFEAPQQQALISSPEGLTVPFNVPLGSGGGIVMREVVQQQTAAAAAAPPLPPPPIAGFVLNIQRQSINVQRQLGFVVQNDVMPNHLPIVYSQSQPQINNINPVPIQRAPMIAQVPPPQPQIISSNPATTIQQMPSVAPAQVGHSMPSLSPMTPPYSPSLDVQQGGSNNKQQARSILDKAGFPNTSFSSASPSPQQMQRPTLVTPQGTPSPVHVTTTNQQQEIVQTASVQSTINKPQLQQLHGRNVNIVRARTVNVPVDVSAAQRIQRLEEIVQSVGNYVAGAANVTRLITDDNLRQMLEGEQQTTGANVTRLITDDNLRQMLEGNNHRPGEQQQTTAGFRIGDCTVRPVATPPVVDLTDEPQLSARESLKIRTPDEINAAGNRRDEQQLPNLAIFGSNGQNAGAAAATAARRRDVPNLETLGNAEVHNTAHKRKSNAPKKRPRKMEYQPQPLCSPVPGQTAPNYQTQETPNNSYTSQVPAGVSQLPHPTYPGATTNNSHFRVANQPQVSPLPAHQQQRPVTGHYNNHFPPLKQQMPMANHFPLNQTTPGPQQQMPMANQQMEQYQACGAVPRNVNTPLSNQQRQQQRQNYHQQQNAQQLIYDQMALLLLNQSPSLGQLIDNSSNQQQMAQVPQQHLNQTRPYRQPLQVDRPILSPHYRNLEPVLTPHQVNPHQGHHQQMSYPAHNNHNNPTPVPQCLLSPMPRPYSPAQGHQSNFQGQQQQQQMPPHPSQFRVPSNYQQMRAPPPPYQMYHQPNQSRAQVPLVSPTQPMGTAPIQLIQQRFQQQHPNVPMQNQQAQVPPSAAAANDQVVVAQKMSLREKFLMQLSILLNASEPKRFYDMFKLFLQNWHAVCHNNRCRKPCKYNYFWFLGVTESQNIDIAIDKRWIELNAATVNPPAAPAAETPQAPAAVNVVGPPQASPTVANTTTVEQRQRPTPTAAAAAAAAPINPEDIREIALKTVNEQMQLAKAITVNPPAAPAAETPQAPAAVNVVGPPQASPSVASTVQPTPSAAAAAPLDPEDIREGESAFKTVIEQMQLANKAATPKQPTIEQTEQGTGEIEKIPTPEPLVEETTNDDDSSSDDGMELVAETQEDETPMETIEQQQDEFISVGVPSEFAKVINTIDLGPPENNSTLPKNVDEETVASPLCSEEPENIVNNGLTKETIDSSPPEDNSTLPKNVDEEEAAAASPLCSEEPANSAETIDDLIPSGNCSTSPTRNAQEEEGPEKTVNNGLTFVENAAEQVSSEANKEKLDDECSPTSAQEFECPASPLLGSLAKRGSRSTPTDKIKASGTLMDGASLCSGAVLMEKEKCCCPAELGMPIGENGDFEDEEGLENVDGENFVSETLDGAAAAAASVEAQTSEEQQVVEAKLSANGVVLQMIFKKLDTVACARCEGLSKVFCAICFHAVFCDETCWRRWQRSHAKVCKYEDSEEIRQFRQIMKRDEENNN